MQFRVGYPPCDAQEKKLHNRCSYFRTHIAMVIAKILLIYETIKRKIACCHSGFENLRESNHRAATQNRN
jgi:hypothetical protein